MVICRLSVYLKLLADISISHIFSPHYQYLALAPVSLFSLITLSFFPLAFHLFQFDCLDSLQ